MPSHYKAFLVVITVTALAFWLARPAFTKFMSEEAFARRRNLWLALTVCAFLIPSFWGYMAVAGVLIWRAGKREPNPAAMYLFLLLVVPSFQQEIPGFGLVNQIFPLDHFRLLSLALIVPAAIKMKNGAFGLAGRHHGRANWMAPDVLLVIYTCLPVLLYVPFVSGTGTLRSLAMLPIDVLLPYYVLSRSCANKESIVEALASLALAAVVLVPLAMFESARGWLLYSDIADHWRINIEGMGYLLRDDVLRAQVTSGQSIVLGNFYAVALGLWLYLQANLTGFRRWLGTGAMIGGLLAAYSRGPWVGAAFCVFVFYTIGPNAKVRLPKFLLVSAVISAVLLLSPMGPWIIDRLPFVGTLEEGNVTYRQAVIDRSLLIIQQNPWFGSPYFTNYMEDLRTGQGIIDLLNVYLSIAMAYGLTTLAALILFFVVVIFKCVGSMRRVIDTDPDTAMLGAALTAALFGTLLIIYTVSNIVSVPYIYIGISALMVAYARVVADPLARDALGQPQTDRERRLRSGAAGVRA